MRFGPDFDALITRFSSNKEAPIAIAVSGGSDSVALLCLAHDWAEAMGRKLLVLTVDHGLRAAAAIEAEAVSNLAQMLGHRHQTLEWQSPKPSQNAARQARYALLADAAERQRAEILLTGHTFDDVVETALLRRRRGVRTSAIAGPALAAPVPTWPQGRGLTLLRPLVHTRRANLQAHLTEQDRSWAEDPSNQYVRFERVRIRNFLREHPALAAMAERFTAKTQSEVVRDHQQLAEALARVRVEPSGLINTVDAPISPLLLQVLARCASGSPDTPRYGAIKDVMLALDAPGARRTLNGAWFQKTSAGIWIGRDPGQTRTQTGDVFDGRYIQDASQTLPPAEALPFLVREAAPVGTAWREIISDRLDRTLRCYQTPLLRPVQR